MMRLVRYLLWRFFDRRLAWLYWPEEDGTVSKCMRIIYCDSDENLYCCSQYTSNIVYRLGLDGNVWWWDGTSASKVRWLEYPANPDLEHAVTHLRQCRRETPND